VNDEDSEERSTDEFELVDDVYVHLPVAHHLVKTLLKNYFNRGGLVHVALAVVGSRTPS
jgi:hypothetical protein